MSLTLLRRHAVAKTGNGSEDVAVLGQHAYAVVDGATDKTGLRYRSRGREVSPGLFAAETIADALTDTTEDLELAVLVARAGAALAAERERQHPGLRREEYPSASLALLRRSTREALIVGDCRVGWTTQHGAHETSGSIPPDEILPAVRSFVLEALAAGGEPWDGSGEDPGRAVIMPALRLQGVFANRVGRYGYSVLNGEPVPEELTVSLELGEARRIVLATDGYPQLVVGGRLTLDGAEEHLARMLTEDPFCVGGLMSTKGLRPGQRSFDDRTWLELGEY
ncbi:MAG: hypothetical protein KJS90_08080 [Acidobacteria bacterium]|nr:hypothetical protein [Acidobacteriota bacterium]